MLISKLAQAFGEGQFVTGFAVVLCTGGCLSQLSDGRLCQTSWVSSLGGGHGAGGRSWMMMWGLSQASGSSQCFGTRC